MGTTLQPTPSDPANPGTSLEDAINNQLIASTAYVAALNADELARYDIAIKNFNVNMESGQSGVNEKPPKAPFAWVLTPKTADGWTFWERSKTVTIHGDIPIDTFNAGAPQQPKPPGVFDVGKSIGNGWFSVGQNDTSPNGFTTPPTVSADGVAGMFQKWAAPVGAGWYKLVT